jgi:hypothetical protein
MIASPIDWFLRPAGNLLESTLPDGMIETADMRIVAP